MLRVPSTTSLHRDGILAEAFLLVYPRKSLPLAEYLEAFVRGALQVVLTIINRQDWADFAPVLECAFSTVELIDNCAAGLPAYEVLAMASNPKLAPCLPAAS